MDRIKLLDEIGKKKEEILVDITYGDLCNSKNIEWLYKADKLINSIMKKFIKHYSEQKLHKGDFIDMEAISHYDKNESAAESPDLLLSLPKDRDSKTCNSCELNWNCEKLGLSAMICQEEKENAEVVYKEECCGNCQLYITSCRGEVLPDAATCPGFIRGRIK